MRVCICSEGSGLGSGGEVGSEFLLEAGLVLLEDLVVLDEGQGLSVVRVGLVEEQVEADGSQGEVTNGDLVASDVLASVCLDSLLDGGDPDGDHLEPALLEDGLLLLVLLEVELEVSAEVVLNGIDGGVDLVGEVGVLGVVAVGAAEVSQDGP